MAAPFPYAHYACPCSTSNGPASSKRASQLEPQDEDTFNPHDPRAAYALYPLDNLLFCDECSQIRCQKCVNDEIITWFCPSCLFDVPSGQVRGENNRCARNCYNCPSCTSPLHVTQTEKQATGLEDGAAGEEAYLLFCQYCDWTTLDIGLQFSRPTKITEQINKARKARYNVQDQVAPEEGSTALPRPKELRNHEGAFGKLSAFYKEQMNETGEGQNPYGNSTYGSPANLARIMSIYGGLTNNALKKSREKPQPMREAAGDGEGFAVYTAEDSTPEDEIVQRMQTLGWEGTVSEEQALSTPANYNARFNDELWPAATQLRAKRGKRCRSCRQFIVRPEPKASGLRYRIRILAHNNIPRLSLRLLQPTGPVQHPSFALRAEQAYQEPKLKPLFTQQYILTLRNPIFEEVKVTLATPAITPGRVGSRVTILCPSFTIGAAGDVWDDALANTTNIAGDGGRKAAMASLTGGADGERQPEAGKVWEKTRNSTSVILEIVPGSLEPEDQQVVEEGEDDDVLEVPVYVRVEWTADPHVNGEKSGEKEAKEARELGYWCVLGLGRISNE
jgi:dynactin-4